MSTDAPCSICTALVSASADDPTVVYADDTWVVRVTEPVPVTGWLQMATRRHTADFSQLDDSEAATFGPVMRRVQRAMLETTGAQRVYMGSVCEHLHHFHASFFPRFDEMPGGVLSFDAFGLRGRANNGEFPHADPAEISRVAASIKSLLGV